jgi:hypoxanthine phosphoribosyltransferase
VGLTAPDQAAITTQVLPGIRGDAIGEKHIETMLSAEELDARIAELGEEITEKYQGTELHVIGVLKGCFMFLADLVREIDLDMTVDFLGLSSYGDSTKSSGVVRMTQDLSMPIEGKNVLIVEDIVDTGLTMSYLLENLETRHPETLDVCTLLYKPENLEVDVPIDYKGFTVPNDFVIGYGLDHAQYYRNLPFIGVVRGEGLDEESETDEA